MLEIQKKLSNSFYAMLALPATAVGFALSTQIAALSWILNKKFGLKGSKKLETNGDLLYNQYFKLEIPYFELTKTISCSASCAAGCGPAARRCVLPPKKPTAGGG
jgi:hypothetical protein